MAALSSAKLTLLRRAFVDICRGYSKAVYRGREIYIRHLTHFSHLSYDLLQQKYEEEAIAKGAKREEERLKELRAQGRWSDEKERDIIRQKDGISRFEDTIRVTAQPSVVQGLTKQLEEEKDKLHVMLIERANLLGMTAEVYAQRMLNDYYVVTNLFSTEDLKTPLFTFDSFDDLEDSLVEEILKVYHEAIEPCGDQHLKYLAVQDFFTSYYNLCGDRLDGFYGRPVCEMTYYQVRLGSIARYFKSIMDTMDFSKLDPKVRGNPDEIERLYTAQRNAEAMQAEGKVPTNLTSDDIKNLGLQGQMTKITGEMSGNELIKHLQRQRPG